MELHDQPSIADKIISLTSSTEELSGEPLRIKLMELINTLIQKDFNALLQLLYRVDVDEKKIRIYLNENKNLDSASILADMIIERQQQKMKIRKQFRSKTDDNEEKW